MTLADLIKCQCAAALDSVANIIPDGFAVDLSIVVSLTGQGASDAIIIGSHDLADLADVVRGVAELPGETGDVTAAGYEPDEGRTRH